MDITILSKILMLAFLCEALTKTIKDIVSVIKKTKSLKEIAIIFGNIIIGISIALSFDVDITYILNDKIDVFGCVLTGIIASRGANFVHDVSSKLRPSV